MFSTSPGTPYDKMNGFLPSWGLSDEVSGAVPNSIREQIVRAPEP